MSIDLLGKRIKTLMQEALEQKKYPYGNPQKGLSNKIASGRLYKSIDYKIDKEDGAEIIAIIANDYFQWVNSGRLPHKGADNPSEQFKKNLRKWIDDRGIVGRDKKGRFIKKDSLVYLIRRGIYKNGIRPANIVDYVIEKVKEDAELYDLIDKEYIKELENIIRGI